MSRATQSQLFGVDEFAEEIRQSEMWVNNPALTQWHRVLMTLAGRDFQGKRENVMGFMGELLTHVLLLPLALHGGMVHFQHSIDDDTHADFFVDELARYPNGIAIETRLQTGSGSHDKKLVATMQRYDRLQTDLMLFIIGNKVSPGVWKDLKSMRSGYANYCDDLLRFLDWVQMTEKAQRERIP